MNKYHPDKYWEERLSRDFSLDGVGYSGLGIEYNRWLYKSRVRALNKLLKKFRIDPSRKKILDIGVGTGFYIDFWEKLGVRNIVGLDITQKSISELKAKYPKHTFIKGDISEKRKYFYGKFDIITAFDVLFHIKEEEKFENAIKNIKNFSHRNTLIFIFDNFLKSYKPPAFHENDRTLSRYEEVLKANSMKIIKIQPIFYLANSPIDINAIKNIFFRFFVSKNWNVIKKILYYRKKLKNFGKIIGFLLGLLLYYIDGIILYTQDGPSTKLLLAKIEEINNND